MAPRKWDAYRSLNITGRDSNGMTCVGSTKWGNRCRWDVSHDNYSQVRSILHGLETKPPIEATSSLLRLARLSLCEEYHERQAHEKSAEWVTAILEADQLYESGRGLKKENRKLGEKLDQERTKRERLEGELEELSGSYHAIVATVNQVQKEARDNKEFAERIQNDYNTMVAAADERIRLLHTELEAAQEASVQHSKTAEAFKLMQKSYRTMKQRRDDLKMQSDRQIQEISSQSLQLEELNVNRATVLTQVKDLTSQLESERHTNSTLISELTRVQKERDAVLLEKNHLGTQLDVATQTISKLRLSLQDLQDAEAAKNVLSGQIIDIPKNLDIERQKSTYLTDELAHLREMHSELVQEGKKLRDDLLSEQGKVAQTAQKLDTTKHHLSSICEELKATHDELSLSKKEVEEVQVELTKSQEENDQKRNKAAEKEKEALAQISALTLERNLAKLHPFRIFYVNFIEMLRGRAKSVYLWTLGWGLGLRRRFDSPKMERILSCP